MNIGELCNREVIVIERDEPVLTAAKLMRSTGVGDVVIIEEEDGKRVPVGIVTDRDLAIHVLAAEVDPRDLSAGELFTASRPVMASVEDDINDVLGRMRRHGLRRVPVVETDGSLAGIITVDDILDEIAREFSLIAGLLDQQQPAASPGKGADSGSAGLLAG